MVYWSCSQKTPILKVAQGLVKRDDHDSRPPCERCWTRAVIMYVR